MDLKKARRPGGEMLSNFGDGVLMLFAGLEISIIAKCRFGFRLIKGFGLVAKCGVDKVHLFSLLVHFFIG